MLDPTQSHSLSTNPPPELTTWTEGYGLIVKDDKLQSASWLKVAIEKIKGFFGGEDRTLAVKEKIYTYINNHEKDVRSNGLLILKLAQKGGIIAAEEVKDLDEKPEVHIDAEIQLLILKALKHLPAPIHQQSGTPLPNQVKPILSGQTTTTQVYKNVINEQPKPIDDKEMTKRAPSVTRIAGVEYVGEFINGKMNGPGTLTWPDGRKYEGEFKDDAMSGQGTLTWPGGTKYEGEFKDGLLDGQGSIIVPDGTRYFGEFKNNHPNGQVSIIAPNGLKYVGEFKDGQMNGEGIKTLPNGTTYSGIFADNELNGQGMIIWPDGTIYTGEFREDKLNGQGTITRPDGTTFTGKFKDGEIVDYYEWITKIVGNFFTFKS